MHVFRAPVKRPGQQNGNASNSLHPGGSGNVPRPPSSQHTREDSVDEDERNQMLPEPEGDDEGGFSYDNGGSKGVPLLTRKKVEQGDVIFEGDQELSDPQPPSTGEGELTPYAHRDLKPGYVTNARRRFRCAEYNVSRNIMIADDGTTPILMDFGSTVRARIKVETRQQALLQQVALDLLDRH